MFKLLIPIILLALAVGTFILFTNPIYQDVKILRAESASFQEALGNSKALENERDKLTQKYNAIDSGDLAKLGKLLPDNVDNIRLILEIEKLALPYGMALREVRYEGGEKKNASGEEGTVSGSAPEAGVPQNYGIWELQFSVTGSYNNFLAFLRSLEQNLRIVDISSIDFGSTSGPIGQPDVYKYDFTIKTYWLKK